MEKIDLRKRYKSLYSPSTKGFSLIEIPPLNYLMIDGHGDPNTSQRFQDALQTLYSISYTLKFALKKSQGVDFTVMGLEGLWWMPDMREFTVERKADWDWTLLMLQPDFITPQMIEEIARSLTAKGKAPLAAETRLETLEEGLCVQILYIGAYKDEGTVIAGMHAFIADQGYMRTGKHHEIYLSDMRRVAPEKNRTILRQPIKKA
ncbi:MAG TPA: GyrI-like domain-containing protein [Anaerolineaceae bacterium]|nr:GyrI-like domain-containing protein [Anaerolineaceae bacterium]